MSEIKNQREANEVIAKKLEEAYALIKECEKIADEHKCYFNFELPYGAGSTYEGKLKEGDEGWTESSDEGGWQASSQSC